MLADFMGRLLGRGESYFQFLQGKGYGGRKSLAAEVSAAIRHLPKQGAIVFDVGANQGHWTRELVRQAGERLAAIHAFEPSAHNQAALQSIADPRLKICRFGLSDGAAAATLHFDKEGAGIASLYARRLDHFQISMDKTETIELRTLDSYLEETGIERIDFAKFDIEGHELAALGGAEQALKKGVIGALSFEFGGCNIDSRTFFQDFWYLLKGHGYAIERVNPYMPAIPVKRYDERLEHFRTTNYIAFKA